MINKFHKFVKIKPIIKFLFWFTILQVLSFHFSFTTFAEAPKNYLKGKFFESVENNFLIATEKMLDDRFKKTLIVMLSNDQDGAWGLVINKQIGLVPLKMLINITEDITKDEKKELYEESIPIFWGGPVDETSIFILHTEDYTGKTTINYNGFSITRDYQILFDIALKKGPKKSLVILGYSGWGAGQLEGEMDHSEHWVLSEIDVDIIFKEEPTNRWLRAYENSFIRL